MRADIAWMKSWLQVFWVGLRQWSGDAAYERYVEDAGKGVGNALLSREKFYVEELERKYSRPNRCC
jgi:hypothetical protein